MGADGESGFSGIGMGFIAISLQSIYDLLRDGS